MKFNQRLKQLIAGLVLVVIAAPVSVFARPDCVSPDSDPDGDGFGWENGASCTVVASQKPWCQSRDSDPDGDGFGWEHGASCKVGSTRKAICLNPASDPDGDGFGWEKGQSCLVGQATEEIVTIRFPACSHSRYDSDGDGFGWENSTTCSSRVVGDAGRSITDLVLVTGQSNALGGETAFLDPDSYDVQLDSPVKRVYAYTSNGWSIADLRQIWDLNWFPRTDITGQPANNFAFHFAKQVALSDPDRVIGFILMTAPGEAIAHWDRGGDFFNGINTTVETAIAALPGRPTVKAILWHQGESDWYDTAYYSSKLSTLVNDFRRERWFNDDGLFICGETLQAPVNRRLLALNNDGDHRTGCVSSSGLDSVGDGVHFSAAALRKLGGRYAGKYLDLMR